MTKKIEAIFREEKLNDVKDALYGIGIVGMNVTEVRGHGRQGGIVLSGRTGTYRVDLLPRVQLNIVLSDHNVEKTINIIQQAAQTGNIGDGLIFVYPVDEVIRIRTGERGHDALTYEEILILARKFTFRCKPQTDGCFDRFGRDARFER